MKFQHWDAIMRDIDRNSGGDAYSIDVTVMGGASHCGYNWAYLNEEYEREVIVLSKPDKPPVYVPISYLTSVALGEA